MYSVTLIYPMVHTNLVVTSYPPETPILNLYGAMKRILQTERTYQVLHYSVLFFRMSWLFLIVMDRTSSYLHVQKLCEALKPKSID